MSDDTSFVTLSKAKETVKALKEYFRLSKEKKEREEEEETGKKRTKLGNVKSKAKIAKPLPLGEDDDPEDGVVPDEQVLLQVDFKKTPLNKTTYINKLGPLPYPWLVDSQADICLIVKDLNTKEPLRDRELDLLTTREHYKNLLTEETGLTEEFITHRIHILPMRELITEYKLYEARSKLAAAYDVFLADRRLMNNKFKFLPAFLGTKFWHKFKNVPIPVDLSKREDDLGKEITEALEKTTFYVSGKGGTESIQVGIFKQNNNQLAYNLIYVLKELYELYPKNVATLRLKISKSISIPFYADLGPRNEVELADMGPHPSAIEEDEIVDDFPLFNKSDIAVRADGSVRIIKKLKLEEGDVDDDTLIDALEKKWGNITRKRNDGRKNVILKGMGDKRRRRPVKKSAEAAE